MSKIWYCANCGYEVDSKGRCHLCRQKLVASPLPSLPPGDDDEEVGYRIVDWEDRARGRLIEALVAERILHRFEDDDLVVAVTDEERVDALVEELAEVAADPAGPALAGGDEGGARPYAGAVDGEVVLAVEMMFKAAQRLRVDPTDMEADGDVAEASAGVFMTEDYPGVTPDEWAAIGRVTRRLLAALGADEALEDEIRQQAAVLVTLLRPAVATPSLPSSGIGSAQGARGATGDDGEHAAPAGSGPATGNPALANGALDDAVALEDSEVARSAAAVFGAGPDSGAGEGAAAPDDVAGEDGEDDDGEDVRLLGGGPETSYEVPEWLPEQRALLTVLLEDRAIPHAWDGPDLVVPSVDEAAVEALFDQVGGAGDDEDDEARYRELEELFAAVNRLAGDPDDKERVADVIANAGAVEGPTPIGFDDGKWLGLRRRTRTLADALEHSADPDIVASQAVSLRDALRELV